MSTVSNYYYSPSTITRLLHKAVDTVGANIGCYCKSPGIDFTRKRKISFSDIVFMLMERSDRGLNSVISTYYPTADQMPSPSAFSQRRELVYPDALRRIMRLFTDSMNNLKTYHGYTLLACDGSDINTPYNPYDTETFHQCKDGSRGYNQLHLNALYDVMNHVIQDVIIDTHEKKNESKSLEQMIIDRNYPAKSIIIADRGYEKYNLFALCIEQSQYFLIRVKDITSNGILSTISFEEYEDEFDIDIVRTLTRKQTKEVKDNPDRYVRIMTSSPDFEFLPIDEDYYVLPLRVIRFKLTDDTYECLITNLDRDEFPFEVMKELYHLRWNEEQGFKDLKYTLSMTNLCSTKQRLIRQEIYATLILHNYARFIANNTYDDSSKGKKLNFKTTVTLTREFLKGIESEKEMIKKLKKFLIPIRPGRSFERRMRPKSAIPLATKAA